MSVDFTARICDTCEHATVCPHRAAFLAFYNNRDKVMVKCGTDDGELDTSQTVTIRVQHRYLDGPGLKQLYRDYGLHDSCWFPCMAGFAGCPIMRHPFDSPIYSCYPNPAGYIPEICSGARMPNGDRIPFIAKPSTPETNEYYATPYNYQDKTIQDYPGLLWWTCKSCPHHTQCEEEFNFNDLGGTQFSTFGFTDVTVKLGEKLNLSDIPTPKNILFGYTRADSNPEYFEVKDANTSYIIYYNYASDGTGGGSGDGSGDSDTPPIGTPDNPMTTNDIITSELLHTGAIFFNDKAYLYPKPEEFIPMKITINGIICGTIARISDDGVKINPGDTMEVTTTENGAITALITSDESALETNAGELIDGDIASTNETITTIDTPVVTLDPRYSYDISDGNYRAFALVEDDILNIHLIYTGPYELDLDMMKMMNYGFELQMKKSETVIGLVHDVRLQVTVPNNDFTIQLCLKDVNYPEEEYPPIDYTPWHYDEIVWAYLPTRAINMGNEEVNVYQPMAPRKWSATMVNDLTPSYTGEIPPINMSAIHPYFQLLGYATELAKRESFDPNIKIVSDTTKINIATAIRFLESGTVGTTEVYRWFAMWRIQYQICAELIEEQFADIFGNTIIEHMQLDTDKCIISNSTQINSLRDPGLTDELQGQWPIKWMEYKKNYEENDLVSIYNKFMELNLPNHFQITLYFLPTNARSFELKNKLNAESEANLPDAVVPVWTGTMNAEGNEVINNHHLSEYLLTPETAQSLMDKREGNTLTLLAVISPKNCAGLWAYDQSFISYQFTIYENVIGLTTTFIFNGADMVYEGLPDLEYMKGYILNGLLPEDAGHVYLHRENNVISLSGDRAYLYKLLPRCDVKYQQTVTVKSRFTHVDCDVNSSTIAVTYRRGCEIDLKAPDGCSIKSITVDGHNLYEIVDNERRINKFQTDDIDADMKINDDDSITLYINNVGKDIDVLVMLREGDDGSIVGCERCRGYVDAAKYPWIKWYPVCDYYSPSSASLT